METREILILFLKAITKMLQSQKKMFPGFFYGKIEQIGKPDEILSHPKTEILKKLLAPLNYDHQNGSKR